MFISSFSFPTFLLFLPFRLVRSNTWIQWKHLTPERSIDLCLQTFPKLLLLLVPKRHSEDYLLSIGRWSSRTMVFYYLLKWYVYNHFILTLSYKPR
jgi:hypothetical protein